MAGEAEPAQIGYWAEFTYDSNVQLGVGLTGDWGDFHAGMGLIRDEAYWGGAAFFQYNRAGFNLRLQFDVLPQQPAVTRASVGLPLAEQNGYQWQPYFGISLAPNWRTGHIGLRVNFQRR